MMNKIMKNCKGIWIFLFWLLGVICILAKMRDSRSDALLMNLHEKNVPVVENPKLTQLMQELQQAYSQQQCWYYPWTLDFSIYAGEKKYQLQPADFERVTFYMDSMTGLIYFVPSNMQWKEGAGAEQQNEMFVFKIIEIRSRRAITPQPDEKQYCVYSVNITDIRERLTILGTVEMGFSDEKTMDYENIADKSMTENEYTQAVKDMVHGTLLENERYGKYQIYIGEYFMTDYTGIYSEELGDTAIQISAAVVCVDDGYGYFCRFLASDLLEDGKVKIYYHLPDSANVWEENIKRAMFDERLAVSVEVKSEDEIEIPINPYPFVMIPVLDYAVGDDRYPEGAVYGNGMIFY